MNRGASKSVFVSVSATVRLALACLISTLAASTHGQTLLLRTETFDVDPVWDGRNNRATDPAPRHTSTNVRPRFNFGYSPLSNFAGGQSRGEIGGDTFRGDSCVEFNGTRMACIQSPELHSGSSLRWTNDLQAVLGGGGHHPPH
jgi:hypothetical protein